MKQITMNTSEEINNQLRGRGKEYNSQTIVDSFFKKVSDIEICKELFRKDRARQKYFAADCSVGCDNKTLKEKREPAFSRAIYNQRYLSTRNEFFIHLEYEAGLSKDNSQKLDILSYMPHQNKLVAIEYKVKPKGGATGVEYGLLESFCYGLLLEKYLKAKNGSLEGINDFIKRRASNATEEKLFLHTDNAIRPSTSFILAAPVSYFAEFARTDSIRAKDRYERIISMEGAIIDKLKMEKLNCTFEGYLLFSEVSPKKCAIVDHQENGISFPFLNYLFKSISDVKKSII